MSFKEYKFEIIIGLVMAVLFSSLFLNILNWTPRKTGLFNNVSFEMVRPTSEFRNEYSLNDREIENQFINPFKKKEDSKNNGPKKEKPKFVPATKQVVAKDQTKKNDSQQKKNGMSVKIVPKTLSPGLTASDNEYSNTNYVQNVNRNNGFDNNFKPENKKNEDEKKKSAVNFMDLTSSPKASRINEFIMAYKNGEVTSHDFYQIIQTMVQSQDPKTQSYGIYLCYSFPSVQSFTIVTLNSDKFSGQVKTYADEFLFSFNHQDKLQYLAQALQTNDLRVVIKAGEVIILGLQKVKNGQTISYASRDNRGNNDINSTQFFEFLLPIAETLKKSSNQTVASIGFSISQELGSNSVPKTN